MIQLRKLLFGNKKKTEKKEDPVGTVVQAEQQRSIAYDILNEEEVEQEIRINISAKHLARMLDETIMSIRDIENDLTGKKKDIIKFITEEKEKENKEKKKNEVSVEANIRLITSITNIIKDVGEKLYVLPAVQKYIKLNEEENKEKNEENRIQEDGREEMELEKTYIIAKTIEEVVNKTDLSIGEYIDKVTGKTNTLNILDRIMDKLCVIAAPVLAILAYKFWHKAGQADFFVAGMMATLLPWMAVTAYTLFITDWKNIHLNIFKRKK